MEDKKVGRLGGSKVSQIANIFQGMTPNKETPSEFIGPIRSKSMPVESPTYEKEADPIKDSPTQVTVMRTESHLARFNTARALFEKLGEESKGKPDKFVPLQGTKSASNVTDLRSRSSSANSETSHSPNYPKDIKTNRRSRSPSPTHRKSEISKSLIHSNSVPVHNTNVTNGNSQTNGVNGVSVENVGIKKLRGDKTVREKTNGAVASEEVKVKEKPISVTESTVEDRTKAIYAVPNKPQKPEKPERKFNSRELIEKQRNWTSHFSKTRSTRYNSDPNKTEVRLGISNGSKEKTEEEKLESSTPGQPATRSQSFSARLRSPPTSPPPPPIRTDSQTRSREIAKRDRPASVIPTTTTAAPLNSISTTKTESVPVQLIDSVVTKIETKPTESERTTTKQQSPTHEPLRPLSSSSLSPKSPHSLTKSPIEEPPKENLSATSGSLSSLSSPSSPSRVRTEEEKQERESNEKTLDNSLSSLLSTSDLIYGE